jgi:integrase
LYRVEVRRPNGKKVRRSCGKKSSIEFARQLEHELRQQVKQEAGEKPQEVTWGEVARRYVEKLMVEGKSRAVIDLMEYRVRAGLRAWGDCPVSEITTERAREWQLDLRRTRAPGTVDGYLKAVRAAWNAVVGGNNPFAAVKMYRADNSITRFLTPPQRVRLLDTARAYNQRMYQWIVVSLGTGMRRKNVLHLKRDEIDWDGKMIRVRQKGGRLYAAPLSPGVEVLLKAIPDNGSPYFWFNLNTGKPFIFNGWMWRKIKELAGIDQSFRWHDLRHDFGTHIYATTHDLKLAKEALGHRNIATTERYAHLMPEHLRAAIDAVDPLAHLPAHPSQKRN